MLERVPETRVWKVVGTAYVRLPSVWEDDLALLRTPMTRAREGVVADLGSIYGQHCQVEQVEVSAFGHRFPFVKAGANALLRAAIDAYDAGYGVYSIWAYNCR
jgi:hypothetical protein